MVSILFIFSHSQLKRLLSNSQWNKIWSLNGFSIQYTHQYCNGQMMLSTIHKCTCECLQLPFPSPLWMCILYDEMSAGIICVSGDGCQPSHPCNYPTPPLPSAPVCDSDVIPGTPYHWHAISLWAGFVSCGRSKIYFYAMWLPRISHIDLRSDKN